MPKTISKHTRGDVYQSFDVESGSCIGQEFVPDESTATEYAQEGLVVSLENGRSYEHPIELVQPTTQERQEQITCPHCGHAYKNSEELPTGDMVCEEEKCRKAFEFVRREVTTKYVTRAL
jgi:hypothetical protein